MQMEIKIEKMVNALKEKSNALKEKQSDKIFMIMINCFYDGECIDLGAKIVVCDEDEDNFKETYYSFTIGNPEFEEEVIGYIKQDGIVADDDKVYFRQQGLAEMLMEALQECDWIDEDTEVDIEEYD